jgi:hypothetical protein
MTPIEHFTYWTFYLINKPRICLYDERNRDFLWEVLTYGIFTRVNLFSRNERANAMSALSSAEAIGIGLHEVSIGIGLHEVSWGEGGARGATASRRPPRAFHSPIETSCKIHVSLFQSPLRRREQWAINRNKFVYITNTIIYFPWKVQSQDKINDFSTESVLDTWLEEVFK